MAYSVKGYNQRPMGIIGKWLSIGGMANCGLFTLVWTINIITALTLGITVAFIPIAIWIVLIPSLALTFAGMIYSGMAVDYSRNGFTGRHGSMALRIISTVFFVIEALGTLLSLLSCLTG